MVACTLRHFNILPWALGLAELEQGVGLDGGRRPLQLQMPDRG